MNKESHTLARQEGDGINSMQNSVFSQEQLVELVKRTYKRLIELDDQLEKNKSYNAGTYKTVDAVNKLGSLLLRYLELAGISFSGNTLQEHIFDLLQKLESRQKKIEETKE